MTGKTPTRKAARPAPPRLTCKPLTASRWPELERLFGPNGACAGCWCMWWRLSAADFGRKQGGGNRRAFREVVTSKAPTGVLAYARGAAVGWCAIAPRDAYPRLDRSRVFKPIDEEPVWSVSCFFIAKEYRRRGVTVPLLRAAVDYARKKGARIVEGYPVEPRMGSMPAPWAWTGIASSFARAGFEEVARRSETRPMMRFVIPRPR